MDKGKANNRVIFQRFLGEKGGRQFPYPPLYREPDTDYICFTDNPNVHSSIWKVQVVKHLYEELETADLEPWLKEYDFRWELRQEQIQMGPLFLEASGEENIITVPALEELPLVQFDPGKIVPTKDGKGQYAYRKNPVYMGGKYNGRPFLLTIGVPVSNQIGTIDRCLSHIKPLLDQLDAELLVIDTGSTDGTVEVCKKYGARVISHPWCDNMSVVRNEGIYNARGEWYMSIDDDEWFEDVDEILLFFKQGVYRKFDKASYIQRNYMDAAGTGYEDYHTVRMARITPELHFEGRIHDSLTMDPACNRACLLHSCAHHYGFVADDVEKKQNKFLRNTPILMQDVYEYPEDLRYLFQLANEYRCIDYSNVAVKLFAKVIALAYEANARNEGKSGVVMLTACLYETYDRRLFPWVRSVEPLFPLSAPELAFAAWCREGMAFQYKQSPEQILDYYRRYMEGLDLYRKDPIAGQYQTFYGLAAVEQELYIMDAQAMAFCAFLASDAEEQALELLPHISLDVVKERRGAVLEAGLAAGDKVYSMVCSKLSPLQWEEWCGEILDAFVSGLEGDFVYRRQLERLPDLLARLTVQDITLWFEHSEERHREKVCTRLLEYARQCDIDHGSVQELFFCAWIFREAYVENRKRESGREQLYCYLYTLMAFVECYYNIDNLMDPDCHAIPPDIRGPYYMAMALADGSASRKNVEFLRRALEAYPPFHEEIRAILAVLS